MINMKKSLTGALAVSAFFCGFAYAFTPSLSSCSDTSSLLGSPANIQMCLSSCSSLYGSGSDNATLQNITSCKSSLSSLYFYSEYLAQNPQYVSSGGSDSQAQAGPQANFAPAAKPQTTPQYTPQKQNVVTENGSKPSQIINWF